MLLIVCPFCGPRNSDEYSYLGEEQDRPGHHAPGPWRAYLYENANVADWQTERWFHVNGCRRYIDVERHTVTNEIRSTEPLETGQ